MGTLEVTPDPETGAMLVTIGYTAGTYYAWTGAAHNSASTRTAAGVTVTNHAQNPSLEVNVTGYTIIPGTGGAGTITRVTNGGSDGYAKYGTAFGKVAWTTPTTAPGFPGFTTPYAFAAVPVGKWVGMGVWLRSTSTSDWRIAIQGRDVGSLSVLTSDGPTQNAEFAWSAFTHAVQVTGGAALGSMRAYVNRPTKHSPSAPLYFDGLMFVVGDTEAEVRAVLATYFDGSTPDVPDTSPAVALVREDVNGFADVLVDPISWPISTPIIVHDHQAAVQGDVTYTATYASDPEQSVTVSGDLIGGDWLTDVASIAYVEDGPVTTRVPVVTGYQGGVESRNQVLEVLGREYPVVLSTTPTSRRGTLAVAAPTYADAQAIVAVYQSGMPVMLRQHDHPGLDLYHQLAEGGRVRVEALPDDVDTTTGIGWAVTVDFVEVPAPTVDEVYGVLA